MKREIKFRVWNGSKFFFTTDNIDIYPRGFSDDFGLSFAVLSNERSSTSEQSYVKPELVLQQYTGVKDKNGKEIYEGDFLKDFEFPVFFRDGCFFVMIRYDFTEAALYEFDKTELEVIGNVFQNPELKYE